MSRSHLPIAVIVTAILVASCGNAPGLAVSVAGQAVATQRGSESERTPCSGFVGDAPFAPPLTTVRTAVPLTINIEAGQLATEIRGFIYNADAPITQGLAGQPIEEFTLLGRRGAHQARSIVLGRTYDVILHVAWSELITEGEVTHLFRMRVEPP